MMTFDEWWEMPPEFDVTWDEHIDCLFHGALLTQEEVKGLMREAWDARYYTLKVGDI